jgi:hypothetical protein
VQVPGVPEVAAELLAENGYETVESVESLTVEELAAIGELGAGTAAVVLDAVRAFLDAPLAPMASEDDEDEGEDEEGDEESEESEESDEADEESDGDEAEGGDGDEPEETAAATDGDGNGERAE